MPHFIARLLLAALFVVPAVAGAQTYPSKPIRWIVPFPPGGPTDSFSRPVAAKLAELIEAMRSPEIRQRASAQMFELWTSTPEEFARVIRADYEKWGRIVKASGAKVD